MVSSGKLLEQIYERFSKSWVIGDMKIVLNTSFAELICTDQDWNATDIMEFLNFSLSLAKEHKDHIVRFDENIYKKMEQRNQVITYMQHAFRENLFQVWYQPIYNCKTGRFDMAEALIRMKDPEGNFISLGLFVPLAEEHGMIVEISQIVFRNAYWILADTPADVLSSISVNMSMQQLMSKSLVGHIRKLLDEYHFDPGRLKLELTERVLAEDIVRMRQVMSELGKMGIQFALDDFGTGYSKLSVVLDCSFCCVKLDQSMVQRYMDSERFASIINAVLNLFHNMKCQVIAEGVETEEQAEALIRQGTDWIQGFYYARPMPEKELLEFIVS